MAGPLSRREAVRALLAASMLAEAASAQPERPALELGVLPNISARLLLTHYQPMREYLARELRRPVQVSTAPGFASFHQRTLSLDYELVVTAANLARLAQIDRGFRPLLVYTPDIRGLIVCASARPLKEPADLQGQTLVLSNPQSLVTVRGMQWLAERGLQRGRDFQTVNTPTDDSVGNVLLRGDAAAAMLSGGEFRAIAPPVRERLQVMLTFAEVPGFVVMASPKVPAPEAAALKELLLQFVQRSEEGKTFLAATGFSGMRELPVGLMESLDNALEATRQQLFAAN
jgi:phosphonate transport system substrate-binding protein